jgi:hypothetical protein
MIIIRTATIHDLTQVSQLIDLFRIFYRNASDMEGAKKFLAERKRL